MTNVTNTASGLLTRNGGVNVAYRTHEYEALTTEWGDTFTTGYRGASEY
jgi:hypothetical protein